MKSMHYLYLAVASAGAVYLLLPSSETPELNTAVQQETVLPAAQKSNTETFESLKPIQPLTPFAAEKTVAEENTEEMMIDETLPVDKLASDDEQVVYQKIASLLPEHEEVPDFSHDELATPVPLWDNQEEVSEQQVASAPAIHSNIASESIRANIAAVEQLQVGQELTFPVPHELGELRGRVESTHNQLNGDVEVWSGTLDDGGDVSNFTLSKGQKITLVTLVTDSATYQVEYNNRTGQGSVWDTRETNQFNTRPEGDFVVPGEEAHVH